MNPEPKMAGRDMKITLFIPCFIEQVYPQVGISVVKILEKLGHTVAYPEEQTCCGQPAFNSGDWSRPAPWPAGAQGVSRRGSGRDALRVLWGDAARILSRPFQSRPEHAAVCELASRVYEFSES